MDIRPLDVNDDADMHAYYEARTSAERFERPDAPMWAEHEISVNLRHRDPSEKETAYLALDGDVVVGAGLTTLSLLDNTDKGFVSVTVPPEHRGRGVGSALLHHLVELCRVAGRSVILADAVYSISQRESHPYRRFAEKHGFQLSNTEVVRLLDLPVSTEQLDTWSREAAEHHDGYKLETFVDTIPAHLVEDYCFLDNQVVLDAPTGDIDFEPQGMTPESFAIGRAKLREQGRTVYDTLAIDSGGRAVAYSTLAVPAFDPVYVFQWGTYVHRDHRGHRLGLAVKAANLRAMQAAHPERRLVFTCNSETNAPMVDINELMGFRRHELLADFQLKL